MDILLFFFLRSAPLTKYRHAIKRDLCQTQRERFELEINDFAWGRQMSFSVH